MTEAGDPIVVRLQVADPVLADRLTALLTAVPGLHLAVAEQVADIVVVAASAAPPPARDGALTPRESEVLALLAEGASNKAVARQLGISVHTVQFHVRSLLDKLDATGRTDAVAHAARTGVIQL